MKKYVLDKEKFQKCVKVNGKGHKFHNIDKQFLKVGGECIPVEILFKQCKNCGYISTVIDFNWKK